MAHSFGSQTIPLALGPVVGSVAVAAGLDLLARPPEWLLVLEDPDRVLDDLRANRARLGFGAATLDACKFKRARLEAGTWSTLHRLKVRDPDGRAREVDLRGRLRLPGSEPTPVPAQRHGSPAYLPDLRLEIQPQPVDAALSGPDDAMLARSIETALRSRGGPFSGLRLAGCRSQMMRNRPGLRRTIRCDLEYPPGARPEDWPEAVIAKVYDDDAAQHTYTAMTALWSSPLGRSATVTIAEPLAVVPEHHLLLQRVVPGEQTLKSAIADAFGGGALAGVASLSDVVRRIGRGLAELHGCGVTYGPQVTWTSQMTDARSAAEQLTAAVPHLSEALEPLLTGLDRSAGGQPSEPLVPTHRSFRPAQVLLGGPQPALVDFDGFCQAEQSLDLSLFRTTLCDLTLRRITRDHTTAPTPAEFETSMRPLDDLCATFLAGYREVRPVNPERLAVWDALLNTMDLVDCWRELKFEHLDRRIRFLRRRLGIGPGGPG
ncbi:MAG TPA: phosphotransferase [Marmoricola sp.]|nr:phosphotransferase [Marmoricola sp.]